METPKHADASLAQLDETIRPATVFVPEHRHQKAPARTNSANTPRPHYIPSYLEPEQFEREKAALAKSSETHKNHRILAIMRIGWSLIAISGLLICLLAWRQSLFTLAVMPFAIAGLGLVKRKTWGVSILKYTVYSGIFGILGVVTVMSWAGAGLTINQLLPALGIVAAAALMMSYLTEPRTYELFD